jgi:hypothetical protein
MIPLLYQLSYPAFASKGSYGAVNPPRAKFRNFIGARKNRLAKFRNFSNLPIAL